MPPLVKQMLPILLRGLDAKSDPRTVGLAVPGKLLASENAYQDRTGELRKRDGMTSKPTTTDTGSIANGRDVATLGDELFLATKTDTWTWSTIAAKWVKKATRPRCALSSASIASVQSSRTSTTPSTYRNVDSCSVGGMDYYFYLGDQVAAGGTTKVGLFYTVIEQATGAVLVDTGTIVAFTSVNQPEGLRAYALGGSAWCVYKDNAFRLAQLSPSAPSAAPTLSAPVIGPGGSLVSMDVIVSNSRAVLVYRTTGAAAVRACRLTSAGAVDASPGDVVVSAVAAECIGLLQYDGTNGELYFGWSTAAAGVTLVTMNATTLALISSTVMDATNTTNMTITGYRYANGTKVVLHDKQASTFAANNNEVRRSTKTSGGAVATTTICRAQSLAAKGFENGTDEFYFGTVFSDSVTSFQMLEQVTNFVVSDTLGIVARYSAGRGKPPIFGAISVGSAERYLPSVVKDAADRLHLGAMRLKAGAAQLANTGASSYDVVAVALDFDSTALGPPVQVGDSLLMPGGIVTSYDGAKVQEHGFLTYPPLPTLTAVAGGALPAGVYQVCLVYTWTDAKGRVHRSAAGPPATVTAALNNKITTVAPTCRTTLRTDMAIEFYMTEAGGTIFYLVKSVANDSSVNTVTQDLTGGTGASAISIGAILYTQGGILDNIAPPSCRFIASHRGRAYAVGCEDPNEIWVSKELVSGEGVAFSDGLTMRMDDGSGPVLGAIGMDSYVLFFKEDKVSVVSGDGPADNGQGMFVSPQPLPAAAGTTEPRSLVAFEDGVLVRTPSGVQLIDRSLGAAFVGGGVYDLSATNTVTGAVSLPASAQVRLFTASGPTLVYDYRNKDETGRGAWYTFTGLAANGACVWGGLATAVRSDGVVLVESPGVYSDDGAGILPRIEFAPIHAAGLGGEFRVYAAHVIGQFDGNHTLRLTAKFSLGSASDLVYSLPITSGDPYRKEAKLGGRRCTAVGLVVEEVAGSVSAGFRLSALALQVAMKGSLGRVATSNRLGRV